MKTVMRKEKAVREKSLQTRKLTSRSLMMKDLLSNTMERSKALMMINLKKTMLMMMRKGDLKVEIFSRSSLRTWEATLLFRISISKSNLS